MAIECQRRCQNCGKMFIPTSDMLRFFCTPQCQESADFQWQQRNVYPPPGRANTTVG